MPTVSFVNPLENAFVCNAHRRSPEFNDLNGLLFFFSLSENNPGLKIPKVVQETADYLRAEGE